MNNKVTHSWYSNCMTLCSLFIDIYKYLGIVIDSKFKWNENTENMMRKVNPRMYCLRKLKKFGVRADLLLMFYNAVISSAISFGAVCWGGNVSKHDQGRWIKSY